MSPLSLTFSHTKPETADAFTLYFKAEEKVHYLPGQYIILHLPLTESEVKKAYVLSSSPLTDDTLSFTIKATHKSKSLTYLLEELRAGDTLTAYPPLGDFTVQLHPDQIKHYLFMVAGIGIAAVISMIKAILAGEPQSKVSLWYGSRKEEDIIFKDQLVALRKKYEGRLITYFSLSSPSESWRGPSGRLDQKTLYQLISDLFMEDDNRKAYYICGPSGMMSSALEALEKHAVHHSDIYQLNFELTPEMLWEASQSLITQEAETANQPDSMKFEDRKVKIIMDGETFEIDVDAGKTILEAAMDAQLDPPYSCQAGICTTCKALLHNGEVYMEEDEGLTDDELEEGYVLTCQGHPLTEDVELEFE
ncbi:MAG: iron-sulfur cluster-binding domain-containing protein [Bacteroidota bacterium]